MYGTEKDIKYIVNHITSEARGRTVETYSAAAAVRTWLLLGLVLQWAHRDVYETPAALLAQQKARDRLWENGHVAQPLSPV